MKRRSFAIGLLVCSVMVGQTQQISKFLVKGPTIIAFFPQISEAELENDPDTNEALSDFQLYASQSREPLRRAGVEFNEVHATAFKIRDGTAEKTFLPKKVKVGYYFIAPGKKPRVEYGVMTDSDLLAAAKEYFGLHN